MRIAALTISAMLASAATLPAAHAQQVYRCGATYSQTPCANDAKAVRVPSAPPDEPEAASGKALCERIAPTLFADPASVQIADVTRAPATVIEYADKPTVAKAYSVSLNSKNAAGAYVGVRTYTCYLSEDEQRLLRFAPRTK